MRKIEYAYLETTNYCNLDCSFCNRKDVIGPLKHISLDNWQLVLDKLKAHPLKTAKLMGMGEPMLHPQFDIIMKMFKKTFPNCFTIVATNCQYDISNNTKMGKKFRNCMKNIDMLYFSIDGYKENYERDRAPATWTKLIQFLNNFKDVDRKQCDAVVNYVVNAYNIYDIPKVDKLREEYNLGKLRLNIAQIWDEKKSIHDDIQTSGYSIEQLNYLKQNWKDCIMGKTEWKYSDCFWIKNGIYVTVEGNIKFCCMNTGAVPIGNLFNDSIEDIYKTDYFNQVKTGCVSNCPTSHCKNCSYNELIPILKEIGVQNA